LVEDDGRPVGQAVYHLRGDRHIFVHTEVDDAYEGQGVASALARHALDDVRDHGGRIVPLCPFISAYVARHPEYQALIDQELLDRINGKSSDS
jgi:predicted GNAT family acetyltransferase